MPLGRLVPAPDHLHEVIAGEGGGLVDLGLGQVRHASGVFEGWEFKDRNFNRPYEGKGKVGRGVSGEQESEAGRMEEARRAGGMAISLTTEGRVRRYLERLAGR